MPDDHGIPAIGGAVGTTLAHAASAFAHPIRARVVLTIAAADTPLSPSTLAKTLQEPLGNVSYHINQLLKLGALTQTGTRPVRGALEHFYAIADDDYLRAVIAALAPFTHR